MSAGPDRYLAALERARVHAQSWLGSLASRPVGPTSPADALLADFGGTLPEGPADPADVVDDLARIAEPGLMASPSGRFFGWVMGGTLPAALAADWLVSAWDQNAGMRYATPGVVAAEEAASAWLLDLLGLPADASVGFTTGGTMANFVGLAAGRTAVLGRVGWDVARDGLNGGPRVTVLAGADRHASVDLALRYLGLGLPTLVAADDQGRIRVDALADALEATNGPVILCLQAGNLHSGAFDPIRAATELAHRHGAWVHVDGAFGLWAAASPTHRHLADGIAAADSWATDAHKTLNVPYDCGVGIVAHPDALEGAMSVHASYLINDAHGTADPYEKVPEMSRRARGVPVWAALRSLGRSGVEQLVDGLIDTAAILARELSAIPGVEVVNEVEYTQVCLSFGSDERTRAVTAQVIEDGEVWMSGSHWQGRDVLRISVSNWSTDASDIATSVAAITSALAKTE